MLSIDITSEYLHCVDGAYRNGKLMVNRAVSLPLAHKILSDDDVLDEEYLVELIARVTPTVASKDIVFTYSLLPVVANEFEFPYLKNKKQFYSMVKNKALGVLSPEEFMLDFRMVDVFQKEHVKKCRVMTYIFPRSMVESSRRVAKRLSRNPKKLAISQDSVYNFANTFIRGGNFSLLNLSKSAVQLHLYNAPNSILTRSHFFETTDTAELLGWGGSGEDSVLDAATKQITKLTQYQAIKNPDSPIEKIFACGDLITQESLLELNAKADVPLYVPDAGRYVQAKVPISVATYMYALCAML